jgi:hypothetical protein
MSMPGLLVVLRSTAQCFIFLHSRIKSLTVGNSNNMVFALPSSVNAENIIFFYKQWVTICNNIPATGVVPTPMITRYTLGRSKESDVKRLVSATFAAIVAISAAGIVATASSDAEARSYGHGGARHGGGGHGGARHGGGGHGGHHGGHYHRGHYYGGGYRAGVYFGAAIAAAPWVYGAYGYGYPYYGYGYGYPYYGYGAAYYPPVVEQPSVYIEQQAPVAGAPIAPPPSAAPQAQAQAQQQYWYFCQDTQTYFPHVQNCASAWQRVVPHAPR